MNSLSRIPKNPTKNSKCIIMLHGVGSNKEDLFGLSSYFSEEDYIFSLD
jgi:predicted esterase